jgi:hypothetical protein
VPQEAVGRPRQIRDLGDKTYPGASSLGSDARRGLKDHPTVKPTAMLEDALLDANPLKLRALLEYGTDRRSRGLPGGARSLAKPVCGGAESPRF